MESSNLKNMVILRNLPSNLVEEAIIVLKTNKNAKKLEKIDYIAINKKTQILTPTKRGEAVYEIVSKTMPDLLNPELTASWEKGLTMVAQKEISADEFMKKLEEYIRNKVVKFKKSRNQYLYGY